MKQVSFLSAVIVALLIGAVWRTTAQTSIPADKTQMKSPFAINWNERAKLTASDSAAADHFGYAVAISGDTVVIGAYTVDTNEQQNNGSVYVFIHNGENWIQQAKLTANDPAADDNFGAAVAISGDTVIVGTPNDDDGGMNSGSAYIFVRDGANWSQQAKLTASDAATNDLFGWSVAMSGDTAVVGAHRNDTASGVDSGSAYVFVRNGTNWAEQTNLMSNDLAADDAFGHSVAISDNTVVIGAWRDDDAGSESGSAYVFVRSNTSWSQQTKLTASDAAAGDLFGIAVAISGDTAVFGAAGDDDQKATNSGSAYIFTRTGTNWSQQAKLTASGPTVDNSFGWAVAVDGDTAVIGAFRDGDAGLNSGSAYVFRRSGSNWTQQNKLVSSDLAEGDQLGYAGVISGNTIILGAPYDDDGGTNSGSVYVFSTEAEAGYVVYLPLLETPPATK